MRRQVLRRRLRARISPFREQFPRYQNQQPLLIGCGPDGNKQPAAARWTREFLAELESARRPRLDGWDAHFYTWNTGNNFGSATEFTLDEYYGLLQESLKIGDLIDEQRAILDASPIGRDAQLILGEWGIWHAPESDDVPLLYQSNTLRDAISAAMTLDLFHEKSEKLAAATLAQTVNVLQSLLQTRGDQTIKTPTYHVFDLYRGHRGGRLLQSQWESGEAGGLPRLSGSASIHNGVVTLTVVNTGARSPVEATIALPSLTIESVTARQMSAPALSECNTFEDPETLKPQPLEAKGAGRQFVFGISARFGDGDFDQIGELIFPDFCQSRLQNTQLALPVISSEAEKFSARAAAQA